MRPAESAPGNGDHAAIVYFGEPDGQGIHVTVCTKEGTTDEREKAGTELILPIRSIDYETACKVRKAVECEVDGTLGRRETVRIIRGLIHGVLKEAGIESV